MTEPQWPQLPTNAPHPLHNWVEMKLTPVIVEVAKDGYTLVVTASDMAIELSDNDAQYGCWVCGVDLTTASYDTACSPASNQNQGASHLDTAP